MIETPDSRQTYSRACVVKYLGLVPYQNALIQQETLRQLRAEGRIPDTVLLLQHPHVYTTGRFRGEEDIIVPPEGIPVRRTNGGGSVTYHGPGQLVGYPVIDLRANGMSVRKYIWKLEEVIIRFLGGFDIQAQRYDEYSAGVWARGQKICSIGINVSRHTTTHGFALNVNNDLKYYDYIRPCGLIEASMTSMATILGHRVPFDTIVRNWIPLFSAIFELEPKTDMALPVEEVAIA